jgi:hypothetical protein
MIVVCHATTNPWTMMVHFEHAFAAEAAMMDSGWFDEIAFLAIAKLNVISETNFSINVVFFFDPFKFSISFLNAFVYEISFINFRSCLILFILLIELVAFHLKIATSGRRDI